MSDMDRDSGIKLMMTGGISAFLLAAVFWAGATYNRVQAIEGHLGSIDAQLSSLTSQQADITRIQERQDMNTRRIDDLEKVMKQLR